MALTSLDTGRLLLAILLLLSAAHGFGYVFVRLNQPRVVGEIVGGILLGPTLLGALAPSFERSIFEEKAVTAPVLGACVQFGLQLLMFASGAEFHAEFGGRERRTAAIVSATGTLFPFLGGLALVRLLNLRPLMGPAQSLPALVIVLAVGVAVTSIPVISRIMMDLGVIATPFARVVLGAAVVEDLVLYAALAVALGLASAHNGRAIGLPRLLDVETHGVGAESVYYVVATLFFFAASLAFGPRMLRGLARWRFNVIRRGNVAGALLAFMLAMTGLALVAGVAPMFGAFLAGVMVGAASPNKEEAVAARNAIKQFSLAFFVPIYFAIVGLRLDLRHDFDLGLFVFFVAYACAWKMASVYAGARLAGESHRGGLNLAAAMNARGGPGIVLASVAHDAKIIGGALYTTLVLLALSTSMLAGAWLERQVKRAEELL